MQARVVVTSAATWSSYGHTCNAWCSQGTHAGVAYSTGEMTWKEAVYICDCSGREALSLEPAPEAGEYAPDGVGPFPFRYLLRWRDA